MPGGRVPKIIRLVRQAKGLNADPDDDSLLNKLTPNVPGIVTFADHNKKLPWSTEYSSVLMFADVSGFTALCERYSAMQHSGIDKLTKTLNGYLGAIVEKIILSEGDILKFAGDAILAVWRINSPPEMSPAVDKVTQCCLDIQKDYGEWQTDIGITLTVKMGVSAGPMKVTFLGNNEYRVYVETGKAVFDVNVAEHFCQSGYIVLSPDAWCLATQRLFETEMLLDNHVRILGRKTIPEQAIGWGRKSLRAIGYAAIFSTSRRMSLPASPTMPAVENTVENTPTSSVPPGIVCPEPTEPKVSSLSKLRRIVKTVTEMKLDEALRLYILPPVLKKIDDFQPLEYLSEMRQVSIVFINLALDKEEDDTKLLQRIFEVVHLQIKPMHGCLNKVFLFDKGCTFLVLFGLPGFKHEQDCAHALMCSYKMRSSLHELRGVLNVSIGVTTGTTFCGVVGHSKRHEYSVIGRKVNMAARLMMHYPDKVTCDDNTFQLSRLPPHNFEVLITKRMKGLRNVGIIREFIESDDAFSRTNSVPYFHYPLLGCTKEVELFQEQINVLKMESGKRKVQHLVYVGASGIGKTRILDHLIICAEEQGFRVISCAVTMNDRFNSNFLTRHILRMLVTSAGFSYQIDREPVIVERFASKGLLNCLNLMPSFLGTQLSQSSLYYNSAELIKQKSYQIFELISTLAELCVSDSNRVVIALDDAHNIDDDSWKTLHCLSKVANILLILTIRPTELEEPSCPTAPKFFDSPNVYIEDISGIENRYLTALACQLMDVSRIPKSLEKLLKERCHGVPYWCEQVLIDMVAKQQLLILETDVTGLLEEQTITPLARYIKPIQYRTEHPAAEYKQCNDIFRTPTALESLHMTDEPKSHNFLKDLGYVHRQTGQKEGSFQRIAIFSPHVNPEEIPVPDIMKDLITAKIDSMRATEQLIVKCAAVLGETFSRDMLESILPNVNRIKARKSLKVLRKVGIFECANLYNPHYNKFSKAEEGFVGDCCCPSEIEYIDKGLCHLMKFTNLNLMETCYQILMESQRKSLHVSAAEYLEKKADAIRKGIPYYTLERPPPKVNDFERNRNHSRRRSSNRVEDIAMANAESYLRVRGRRKGIQMQDISGILPTLLQSLKSDRTTEQACECLIPLYSQIHHHRKATKDYMKIIDVMVEEAAAFIVMKKASDAMQKLQEAEDVINQMIEEKYRDENDESLNVLYAKLARLTGKALTIAGDKEEAHLYTRHAAKLLNFSEPEGFCNTYSQFWYNWIYLRMLRHSNKVRKPATDRTVEQGYCLAELYEFQKENHDELNMSVNTLRQMIKVTGRPSNLHQTIKAYQVMLEYCGKHNHLHMKDKLEKEFLACCVARNEELQMDDFVIMADICGDICLTSLQKGEINRAISSGTAVIEIGDSMKQTVIDPCLYALLAVTLLFSDKKKECMHVIERMKSYNAQKFHTVSLSWYYSINMEILHFWNVSQESFDDTVDYACKLLSKPDAVSNELLPRYMLSMSVALWYCRHDQWSSAQIWFDHWEMYESEDNKFLSVYILARKVEIMLLSLCVSKRTKPKPLWKLLQDAVKKDLKKLSTAVKSVVSLKPRCYHLEAYFLALKNRFCQSERLLNKALKVAIKQDNKLELGWVKHHQNIWFIKKVKSRGGTQVTGDPTAEWYKLFCSSIYGGYYTWPLQFV